MPGRGVLKYFSVRGSAAEQGTIFRILPLEQGITFVKVGSMTGSIFVILTLKRHCRPSGLQECDVNPFDCNISTFSDRFLTYFQGEGTILSEETQGHGIKGDLKRKFLLMQAKGPVD